MAIRRPAESQGIPTGATANTLAIMRIREQVGRRTVVPLLVRCGRERRVLPTAASRARRRRGSAALAALLSVDADAAELADHGGVAVVEEQRGARIERGDAGHLLVSELEVEHVDVLAHPVGAD
jgi:hypothetical protein